MQVHQAQSQAAADPPLPGPTFADACGEVPLLELAVYNVERLRAIGYLQRFGGSLSQLGLTDAERDAVSTASRSELQALIERAGHRAGWLADPERHLRGNRCRLALVVGERPPAQLGVTPIDPAVLLERFAALQTDVRLFVGVDPFDRDAFQRDLALAQHPNFAGFAVAPFMSGQPLDAEVFAPMLKVITDRGIALWVHASAHFRPDVAYDISHPRHLDATLMRHPGLRLVFGHAGWPWTQDACIVAIRHPSTALEFSTFPPALLRKAGWSLSPLLANRSALRGRIFFGSGATSSETHMKNLLDQLDALQLGKDLEGWRGASLLAWMGVVA
jgi:hypothetical protein